MCTVTVISTGSLVRLISNRDERRTRPISTTPILTRCGPRRALMPIDPASDGTWIGVNDAGIVACLLNVNPESGLVSRWVGRRSRGEIVPKLLRSPSVSAALDAAAGLDAREYPPFRVIILDVSVATEVHSDGEWLDVVPEAPLRASWFATSSGLGDRIVQRPRRRLFEELLDAAPDDLTAQQRLHDHRWPDHPDISVVMSRPDARTVSRTAIDLTRDGAVLTHLHLEESRGNDLAGVPVTVRLDLAAVHAGAA